MFVCHAGPIALRNNFITRVNRISEVSKLLCVVMLLTPIREYATCVVSFLSETLSVVTAAAAAVAYWCIVIID